MPVQPDLLVQWQFVEVSAAPKSRWYWRKFLASSALETLSEEFSDYGLAVSDALRHGFKPKRHPWSVVTPRATTHYAPSGDPVVVPNAAKPGSLSSRAARTVERRRTARPESIGKA